MKRDMELIRLLLFAEETGTAPKELAEYPFPERIYNLQLMKDAGLIVAQFVKNTEGEAQVCFIERLTWEGHDFLDATKDSKIWKMAKDHILKPGCSFTFQTLLAFLKHEIERKILGAPATP